MPPTKNARRRPVPKTAVSITPHPSLGNGHAYSHDFRLFSEYIRDNNLVGNHIITQAQQMYLFPSERTQRRHARRSRRNGHLLRYEKQGNRRATVLRGINNYMLSYWRVVWPKATHAELNALLFINQVARNEPNPRFFHPSQITRAEDRLGLSNKRGSTTAYQALLPRVLALRWTYWHLPYPFGIANIPKDDWIDIDEAGIFVETANRPSGKTYIGLRVREEGPYNHSEKYTLSMAIAGDINGDRWVDFDQRAGTTVRNFYDFILRILETIRRGTAQRRRMFTMDNLIAHKNPVILQLIYAWGHRIAFRAPYYPVDGAIEYVFNTLQQDLTIRLHAIKNGDDLHREVMDSIGAMPNFVNYFLNIRY